MSKGTQPPHRLPEGILYYAVGARFADEAVVSAESVRRQMPNLPLAIFSNATLPQDLFDLTFELPSEDHSWPLRVACLRQTPFDKTIYLDTDTFLYRPIPEIFDLLERFNLAAALSPWWYIGDADQRGWKHGAPACLPNLNCGVIAYRLCDEIRQLLDRWAEVLLQHPDLGNGDQEKFRLALWEGNVRWVTLPPEYNYRLPFPAPVRGPVKLIHGHHPKLASVAERVQPRGETGFAIPVKYLTETRILGRKTVRPRISELLAAAAKFTGRKLRLGG